MIYGRYVYVIRNNANGKVYVGSSTDPQKRLNGHMNNLRNGTHSVSSLQSDFNKYGEEYFQMTIVGKDNRIDGIGDEYRLMVALRSYDPQFGYNDKDPKNFGEILNPIIEEKIGERIKKKREELGLSYEDIYLSSDLSRKYSLSKIEDSGDDISIKNLACIAKALKVQICELCGKKCKK